MTTAKDMCASIDRYELQNTVDKVDGYFIRRPLEAVEPAFVRAKAECLTHLRRQIECIEALTIDQFSEVRCMRYPDRPQVNLELISTALAEVNPRAQPITGDEIEHAVALEMFESFCRELADTFAQDVRSFDRDAFLKHCGLLETMPATLPDP
jgi:non-ribosomal peptide synthetase component F